MRLLLFFFLFALAPIDSHAHVALTSPTPRPGTTDSTKTANSTTNPCGGVNRGANSVTFAAGSNLTFSWRETIEHPGRFLVQFSPANDQSFELPANELFRKEDTETRGTHSATVKLPNTACEACTLRLVQVMDDQPGELYVNCVDIRLTSSSETAPPNSGSPENTSQASQGGSDGGKTKMPAGCALASGRLNQIGDNRPTGGGHFGNPSCGLITLMLWTLPLLALLMLKVQSRRFRFTRQQ
ncbi:MAG: lytic polysaccharide monooxygenase [Bdellovibrionales bacterium]|nr:lytic polysaccharide monooxygenase [Bdellovibrionales bacterium]